jgi:hypothetical protein
MEQKKSWKTVFKVDDGVTEDLHRMWISNWKDKAGDRRAWTNILRKARTHEEL